MKGILCSTTAVTNEEYRCELNKKKSLYFLICVVGLITLLISICSTMDMIILSEQMREVFSGLGFGLMLAGSLLIVRVQYILRDEVRLKKDRLNNSDERNVEISNRSFRSAAMILVLSLYVTALIGSVLIDERLIGFLLINVFILLVGYFVSFVYYKNKL